MSIGRVSGLTSTPAAASSPTCPAGSPDFLAMTTINAEEPTKLRMIDEASVDKFSHVDPSFAGRLYRSIATILVERLRRTSMHISLENRQV